MVADRFSESSWEASAVRAELASAAMLALLTPVSSSR